MILILDACLLLAYEAWKREWQVELEEYYENEQYLLSALESIQAKKTGMPIDIARDGKQVVITLRSDEWRKWVRKSAKQYLDEAKKIYIEASQNKPSS